MADQGRASKERFIRFTERDAGLVRWRFNGGYVAELTVRRYQKMFRGGRRILDIGCGIGVAARWVDGADYFGIDLSETLVQEGGKEGKRFLTAASVDALPFLDEAFDCVTCMGVLHHLTKDQIPAALKEMARVLKTGGKIAIVEPNPWNLYQRLFAYFRSAERGILNTSPSVLRCTFDLVPGLVIEEFEYDHTMFWPSYMTFVMRRWSWPTGPLLTACFRALHKIVVMFTPGPLRSHTFWGLRKQPECCPGDQLIRSRPSVQIPATNLYRSKKVVSERR